MPDKRSATFVLVAAAAAVCVLVFTRLDFVPIWDGRLYAACIENAARNFTAESLRCAGHASQAYAAVAAIVQKVAPASPVPLLLTNAALFAIACVGFARLLHLVFPDLAPLDRAIVTAAFAVHPAFIAGVVQPSIDLPMLPTFVWAIVFALERRFVWMVLCGLALAFTKETGVLLYAVLLACYGIWFELRANKSWSERIVGFLKLWPLAIPGVVFIGYILSRQFLNPNQAAMWMTGTTGDSLLVQFLVPKLDLYQINYAVLLLILSFAWIVTGLIGLDAFVGMVRAGHREPPRPVPGADRSRLGFLVLLTLVTGYALTRFTTFGHTRYFLPVYALMFVPFCAALLRLGVPIVARRAVLGAYAVLLLASSVRTVDPVSRRLYGTFAFGSHEMLRMTRITGECCGFGQDQLAYSAEFTVIQPLTDLALASLVRDSTTRLVVPDSTSWLFLAPDSAGKKFVAFHRDRPSVRLNVIEHRAITRLGERPDSAYYLGVPYGNNARAMRELAPLYDLVDERTFATNGYAISAYRMVRRQSPPQ